MYSNVAVLPEHVMQSVKSQTSWAKSADHVHATSSQLVQLDPAIVPAQIYLVPIVADDLRKGENGSGLIHHHNPPIHPVTYQVPTNTQTL